MLFILVLLSVVSAQENCAKPYTINTVPFNTNITFGENTPLTKIKLRTGETKVQAKYFAIEGTADNKNKLLTQL